MQKILIRGGIAVGKSMLASALQGRPFDPSYRATLGAIIKPMPDLGNNVWLWDLEGETIFDGSSAYALGSRLVLCVADGGDSGWRDQLSSLANSCQSGTAILRLVAKADLAKADDGGFEIDGDADLAVSAKTGEGIAELHQLIRRRLGNG